MSVFAYVDVPRSLPSRGAWIEIRPAIRLDGCGASLPSRGAWIEIFKAPELPEKEFVAPLTGSVD